MYIYIYLGWFWRWETSCTWWGECTSCRGQSYLRANAGQWKKHWVYGM